MASYTYSVIPAGLDFGDIVVGTPITTTCIVKYLPLPISDTSSQPTVTNEIFYIQDNGSLASDWVLLSTDGVNFYNKITIASLPVDYYTKLWVKVNPASPTYMLENYSIELRGQVNVDFRLPIKFRITGAQLCTTTDVRKHLGPIGRKKATLAIASEEFDNLNLWTQVIGTWTVANNRVSVFGVGAGQTGLLIYSSPFVDDYEETGNFVVTAGQVGFVFGYKDSSNYYSVMFDQVNSSVHLIQVLGGTATTLKTVPLTFDVGTTYMVNLKMTSEGLFGVYFDTNEIMNYSFPSSIKGGTGLRVYDSPTVQFFSWYLNCEQYIVDDVTLNDFIRQSETHIYHRTRKLFAQRVYRELYDFRDQEVPSMPYVLARSFNTLPNWTLRRLTRESTLQLDRKPVLNVISLEENVGTDGGGDNWTLRSQGRSNDYVIYPDEALIVWMNNYPHNGHQNIRVTYAAGEPEVPQDVREYCSLLSAEMYLTGFGSPASGIEAMKKDIKEQILRLEEYIPRATLAGSPGGTCGGQSTVVIA